MTESNIFPWLDLPSELRVVIRGMMDNVSENMLGDTCKEESKRTRMLWFWWNYARLFKKAAKNGYFTLCCWIYARTVNWTRANYEQRWMRVTWGPFKSWDCVQVRVGETHYTDRFRIEWALQGGHVSIATWMHSLGHRVRHCDAYKSLQEGNMAAFCWLFKEYTPSVPPRLDHTILDFSIVRYMMEACNARPPLPYQLRKMFKKLPASADVLAYYYSVRPDLIPDRILRKALSGGKWTLVDFIADRMPPMMARTLARWPHLAGVMALGPAVPPKHRLDLDTGEVVPL
jgi:hypothetical protein